MKLQSRCHLGLQSFEGLIGAGGSTSKVAQACGSQLGAGWWRGASVTHPMDLLTGLIESTRGMTSSSPARVYKREHGYNDFDALTSEDRHSHFHGGLFHPSTMSEVSTYGNDQGPMGAFLGGWLPYPGEWDVEENDLGTKQT